LNERVTAIVATHQSGRCSDRGDVSVTGWRSTTTPCKTAAASARCRRSSSSRASEVTPRTSSSSDSTSADVFDTTDRPHSDGLTVSKRLRKEHYSAAICLTRRCVHEDDCHLLAGLVKSPRA
jgi:hypothetical protein